MLDVGAHLRGWEGQMRGGAGGFAFDCLFGRGFGAFWPGGVGVFVRGEFGWIVVG